MQYKTKTDDNSSSNIFWITMTDMMTALVLVFVVMFVFSYIHNNVPQINQKLEQENASKMLHENLQQQNVNATIDAISGVVKISNLELFDINSYTLSNKGKAYLSKFAPIYLNSIFSNEYLDKNVDKIIIQGHTDSQTFAGKYSADEQYMKNMELSLNRAYEVAKYMTNTQYNKTHGNRLRKMIIVEGASYSDPIITNGKENFAQSRRVELKLVMKNNVKKSK